MHTDSWETLTEEDWLRFASAWHDELRKGGAGDSDTDVGGSVVLMNFTARPDEQWKFILLCTELFDEEHLGHVAAGPFEHLLGNHGDHYIDIVEEISSKNQKFALMVSGAWKYKMSDEIWSRVQAIQDKDS